VRRWAMGFSHAGAADTLWVLPIMPFSAPVDPSVAELQVIDLASGAVRSTPSGIRQMSPYLAMAASPDGGRLAVAYYGIEEKVAQDDPLAPAMLTVDVFDADSLVGRTVWPTPGDADYRGFTGLGGMAWSPSGRYLSAELADGLVVLESPGTGDSPWRSEAVPGYTAFTADRAWLTDNSAVATSDGGLFLEDRVGGSRTPLVRARPPGPTPPPLLQRLAQWLGLSRP